MIAVLTIRATVEFESEGNCSAPAVSLGVDSDRGCGERKFITHDAVRIRICQH